MTSLNLDRDRPERRVRPGGGVAILTTGGPLLNSSSMELSPGPRIEALRATIADFLEKEVYPLEEPHLWGEFAVVEPLLEELRAEVRRRGWWLPQIPEVWGGMGLSLLEHAHLSEVLGRTPSAITSSTARRRTPATSRS